ncbi:hypothetical protein [Bradyrhizobium sp. USDA 4369]
MRDATARSLRLRDWLAKPDQAGSIRPITVRLAKRRDLWRMTEDLLEEPAKGDREEC